MERWSHDEMVMFAQQVDPLPLIEVVCLFPGVEREASWLDNVLCN